MHCLFIFISVHEFRTLDTTWKPQVLRSQPPQFSRARGRSGSRGAYRSRGSLVTRGKNHAGAVRFSELSDGDQTRQGVVVRFLLEQMQCVKADQDLRKQDVHGNAALHYLVSCRRIDETLLQQLRAMATRDSQSESEDLWSGLHNHWGFTAKDLYRGGELARQDWGKEYMPFWRESDPEGIM